MKLNFRQREAIDMAIDTQMMLISMHLMALDPESGDERFKTNEQFELIWEAAERSESEIAELEEGL